MKKTTYRSKKLSNRLSFFLLLAINFCIQRSNGNIEIRSFEPIAEAQIKQKKVLPKTRKKIKKRLSQRERYLQARARAGKKTVIKKKMRAQQPIIKKKKVEISQESLPKILKDGLEEITLNKPSTALTPQEVKTQGIKKVEEGVAKDKASTDTQSDNSFAKKNNEEPLTPASTTQVSTAIPITKNVEKKASQETLASSKEKNTETQKITTALSTKGLATISLEQKKDKPVTQAFSIKKLPLKAQEQLDKQEKNTPAPLITATITTALEKQTIQDKKIKESEIKTKEKENSPPITVAITKEQEQKQVQPKQNQQTYEEKSSAPLLLSPASKTEPTEKQSTQPQEELTGASSIDTPSDSEDYQDADDYYEEDEISSDEYFEEEDGETTYEELEDEDYLLEEDGESSEKSSTAQKTAPPRYTSQATNSPASSSGSSVKYNTPKESLPTPKITVAPTYKEKTQSSLTSDTHKEKESQKVPAQQEKTVQQPQVTEELKVLQESTQKPTAQNIPSPSTSMEDKEQQLTPITNNQQTSSSVIPGSAKTTPEITNIIQTQKPESIVSPEAKEKTGALVNPLAIKNQEQSRVIQEKAASQDNKITETQKVEVKKTASGAASLADGNTSEISDSEAPSEDNEITEGDNVDYSESEESELEDEHEFGDEDTSEQEPSLAEEFSGPEEATADKKKLIEATAPENTLGSTVEATADIQEQKTLSSASITTGEKAQAEEQVTVILPKRKLFLGSSQSVASQNSEESDEKIAEDSSKASSFNKEPPESPSSRLSSEEKSEEKSQEETDEDNDQDDDLDRPGLASTFLEFLSKIF